jgi:hypothetical protein
MKGFKSPMPWLAVLASLIAVPVQPARAQEMAHAMPPQGCVPLAKRTGEVGCWIIAEQPLGKLDRPMYWQVDAFADRAAAESARSATGTVVEALGQVWLMTIAAKDWTAPPGATHRTTIGPLPVTPGNDYAAQYMEAVFTPGMISRTHVHSGPEAWYTLSGETCLETPAGMMIDRPGSPGGVVPGGPPMMLMATGTQTRRGLALVLHDSHQPATTVVQDWTPKGLCEQRLHAAQ